jgi:hypothetical protein
MANQQRPNEQEPQEPDHGRDAGNPQQRPGRPNDPGAPRDPASPGGTPGTRRDPYQHPGNEPDVQPDVIGGEGHPSQKNESGKRPRGPGTTDKPRTGNTGGNRSGGQEEGK